MEDSAPNMQSGGNNSSTQLSDSCGTLSNGHGMEDSGPSVQSGGISNSSQSSDDNGTLCGIDNSGPSTQSKGEAQMTTQMCRT